MIDNILQKIQKMTRNLMTKRFRTTSELHSKYTSSQNYMYYPTPDTILPMHSNERADLSSAYVKNVIVHRCISLISRNLARLKWHVEKINSSDDFVENDELSLHDLESLLESPNSKESWSCLMEKFVSSLLIYGNSYLEVKKNYSGTPVELQVLNSSNVKIQENSYGLQYVYTEKCGNQRVIDVDTLTGKSHLLHLKFFNSIDDLYGLSPIVVAERAIKFYDAISEYNVALIENGGRPSLALICDNEFPLTDEQRFALRKSVSDLYQGVGNAGRIAVLEGKFKIEELGVNAKDLDFVTGKTMAAREIAHAFNVPVELVVLFMKDYRAHLTHKEAIQSLYEGTIYPLAINIEQSLNNWLFQCDSKLRFKLTKQVIET
jgi:HK97 family phage portal protein